MNDLMKLAEAEIQKLLEERDALLKVVGYDPELLNAVLDAARYVVDKCDIQEGCPVDMLDDALEQLDKEPKPKAKRTTEGGSQ